MNLLDFLNNYWTVLFGIASFIFALGYTYFGFKALERGRVEDNQKYSEDRAADKKQSEDQMREQKKDHDEKIGALEKAMAATIVKVDSLKDETFKVITMIQLDIREIMTILKNNKKVKK